MLKSLSTAIWGSSNGNESTEMKEFTLEELSLYVGKDNSPIYIALRGMVYDVTSGAAFYGPEGGYAMFAGRDASKCLAKMSFETQELNKQDLSDLTEEENKTLNDWIEKYEKKYKKIGTIKWD